MGVYSKADQVADLLRSRMPPASSGEDDRLDSSYVTPLRHRPETFDEIPRRLHSDLYNRTAEQRKGPRLTAC